MSACLNGEFLYGNVKQIIEPNKIFLYYYLCYWKIGDLTRKISGLNGDIILSKALTTTLNTTKKGEKLQNLMEDEEDNIAEDDNEAFDQEDGEEIKTIAGKEVNSKLESDDLILHLVSTNLGDLHEK